VRSHNLDDWLSALLFIVIVGVLMAASWLAISGSPPLR